MTGKGVLMLPVFGTLAHRMGMMANSSGGTSTEMLTKQLRQALAPGNQVSGMRDLGMERPWSFNLRRVILKRWRCRAGRGRDGAHSVGGRAAQQASVSGTEIARVSWLTVGEEDHG
jgi:hypothetical protein